MSKIRLTGESSGYVELSAGNAAGNNTLELPTSGTKLLGSNDSGSFNITGISTFSSGLNVTGGSVGIGTDNPGKLLHISSNSTPTIRIENTDTTAVVDQIVGSLEFEGNDSSSNANGVRAKIDAEYRGVGAATALKLHTAWENETTLYEAAYFSKQTVKFTTNDVERLRIDSSGNIGIGTDDPDTPLHIQGSSSSFDAIRLSGDIPRKNTIGINGADNLVISVDEDAEGNGSNFRLRVDGAETLRSTFSRIGIGTENDVGVNTCRVYVYNNDVPSYPVLRLENTGGTTGQGDLLHMKTGRGDGTIDADLVKLDLYDDTEIFKVDNAGTVHFRSGCGTGSFAALPVYGVRAWINFDNNGTNNTRGSGGVLTRSDDGVGDYTITFDFTMPDANFFAIADSGNNSGWTTNRARCAAFSRTTTSASFTNADSAPGVTPTQGTDRDVNYVAFIR